jgi:LuxR family maltose regulon positive regulatory protein
MVAPFLTTKLYIPPLRANLVPRLHLIEQLDEELRPGHRLTLVSAPAGFGKTTLVSEWLHQGKWPFTWLSLDDGDNDSTRFLA